VAALEGRVAELQGAWVAARADADASRAGAEEATAAASARIAGLEARIAELEARPGAPVAAPAAAPEAAAAPSPAPLTAARRGNCKVPACEEAVRSKGFCSSHYQQWRRGTLKGFVTAEGTAIVGDQVIHLPLDTAGGHVVVADGRVTVDGAAVTPLPSP
jgi:hypothetical protein